MKIKDCKEDVKIRGRRDSWYIVDNNLGYVMLESCTWGDESIHLVVPENSEVINRQYRRKDGNYTIIPTIEVKEEDIFETYDDIKTCLEDNDII